MIRSTRAKAINRKNLQPLYLNNYPITNKIDFIALKQKNMDTIRYNAFNVYRRELAPGTVSLTGDRAQGDDSKHWAYSTLHTESMVKQKLNTLVFFATYLHTFMHAEPDRSTFLIILQIIVHV